MPSLFPASPTLRTPKSSMALRSCCASWTRSCIPESRPARFSCRRLADPGGAANRRQEKRAGRDSGMQERVQEAQQERSAIDDFGVRRVGEAGNKLGMEDAVDERRNGEAKTYERA